MAINKKLIHFEKFSNFNSKKLSANKENTQYTTGVDGTPQEGSPEILYQSIVYIKDTQQQWTHGTLYKTVNWSILDPCNGYEYVDLGLPSGLKWAKCNMGATTPEEYGDYFAWAETKLKSSYTEKNSVIYNLSNSELLYHGVIDADGNLTAAYDAATANWGGKWHIPTLNEILELINSCTWKWTTQNGVNGYNATGPNGNSIFLPTAGYRDGDSLKSAGSLGYYWSATISEYELFAHIFFFHSSDCKLYYDSRHYGRAVRPVINLNN